MIPIPPTAVPVYRVSYRQRLFTWHWRCGRRFADRIPPVCPRMSSAPSTSTSTSSTPPSHCPNHGLSIQTRIVKISHWKEYNNTAKECCLKSKGTTHHVHIRLRTSRNSRQIAEPFEKRAFPQFGHRDTKLSTQARELCANSNLILPHCCRAIPPARYQLKVLQEKGGLQPHTRRRSPDAYRHLAAAGLEGGSQRLVLGLEAPSPRCSN